MKNSFRRVLGCAFVGVFVAGLASADDSEQMLVLENRSLQGAEKMPVSVQLVTEEDIQRSGARTLFDVLSGQAGLQVNDLIGDQLRGVTISMRGFGESGVNNVLVLVNGRKLNNPSLEAPDFSSIALADVARIEIMQGGAGTLYGDQAVAGVINIITHSRGSRSSDVGLTVGEYALRDGHASWSKVFDSGFSLQLFAQDHQSDNYRNNNRDKNDNAHVMTDFQSEHFGAYSELQWVSDDLRMPGALSEFSPHRDDSIHPRDYSNRDTRSLRSGVNWDLTTNWRLAADISQRNEDSKAEFYATEVHGHTELTTWQPRIDGKFSFFQMDALLTAGIDSERASNKTHYCSVKPEQGDYCSENDWSGKADLSQYQFDHYVQLSLPLLKTLQLTAGGRHSQYELQDQSLPTERKHEDGLNAYELGMNWQIANKNRLFLRLDQSFRWPNFDENAFVSPAIKFLQPQLSRTLEAGADLAFHQYFSSVSLYTMQLQNEIIYDPTADGPFGPGTGANVNLDDTSRVGWLVDNHWQLNEAVKLQLNFSHVLARFRSGSFDGNSVPFVADNIGKFSVSYLPFTDWTIYLESVYTGRRYGASDNANVSGQLGGYTVFNLAVRKQMYAWNFALRINNVNDKDNSGYTLYDIYSASHVDYPAPGRNAQLTAEFRF